ncbi:MAG TPA: AraC family ligand binding domain-containing protein [Gaiellaceae bacterium]
MTARASSYEVAHVDELDEIPVSHGLVWHPIRRRFDVRAFGVNAYTSEEVGEQVVEEHTEGQLGHEEIYLVLHGSATFTLDGEDVELGAGELVHLPDPETRRVAISREEGTTVLALGGKPGEPFEVSAWETMFAALPARRRGDFAESIRLHEEALAERPDHAALLFNLACEEALAGRRLDAILHLQRAIELRPEYREAARTDSDLDPIRREPGFPA